MKWNKMASPLCCMKYKSIIVILLLLVIAIPFLLRPTSVYIRLDTGDLRYYCMGVPVRYDMMSEPQRSILLSVATTEPSLSGQWSQCSMYGELASDRPDLTYKSFYAVSSYWSATDRTILKLILIDLGDYVRKSHAKFGLPTCYILISPRIIDLRLRRVRADWKSNENVIDFCHAHGYFPDAT